MALANYVNAHLATIDIRLLDLGLVKPERIEDHIREYLDSARGQLFVGITTTNATYQSAIRVAEIFKLLVPQAVVILGGHHAAAQDDVVLTHHSAVDFVVRGEGEAALVALLREYPNVDRVPNLTYRVGLAIERTGTGPSLRQDELDQIQPSFRGWGLRSAPGKFHHTTYVSARGCPLRCAFCSVANERIRAKSIDAVIRDLRTLVGEMGYRSIAIEDNFFAHSPRRTIQLCEAIGVLSVSLQFLCACRA